MIRQLRLILVASFVMSSAVMAAIPPIPPKQTYQPALELTRLSTKFQKGKEQIEGYVMNVGNADLPTSSGSIAFVLKDKGTKLSSEHALPAMPVGTSVRFTLVMMVGLPAKWSISPPTPTGSPPPAPSATPSPTPKPGGPTLEYILKVTKKVSPNCSMGMPCHP
jgi:hypothetical protein